MAGKETHQWPSDDEIVEGCRKAGTFVTYAQQLGVSTPGLRHRINKVPGLMKRCHEAMRQGPLQAAPLEDVSREEILLHEVRELRAASRKDRKVDVAQERILQGIERALRELEPPKPGPKPKLRIAGKEVPHHRQLVALSDWHGGERVDPDAVNGLNAYDWEIMEARVDEVVDGLLSHKKNSPGLTGLDVAIVGDQCSGANHQELEVSNEFPLAEQGVKMGGLMGRTIERLVPFYDTINVVSVPGNHPRLPFKPAAKDVHNNMDWVAGEFAREYLKRYPTINFRVSKSGAILHEIAGRTMYVWHGDGIRSSMPGVPWGGVMRRVNEIRRSYAPQPIDYWLCGHFHQANVLADLGLFMNGSLKGCDEWVLKNFGGGSPPCQLLLTFDERKRRLTDVRLLTPTAGVPVAVAA